MDGEDLGIRFGTWICRCIGGSFTNQDHVISSFVDQTFTTTILLRFKSLEKIHQSITCKFRGRKKNYAICLHKAIKKFKIGPKKNYNSSLNSSCR
jgi:hypothetical protein